ncbi:MAG TPA: beta-ketoacyl synthase N-terminal-like domain-containing protein [Thermoanaerobaculia bacterium]|nr:beta-ketoacyl synthase N-terminal-like domain-containing protein [Thermoanaerobaculia bacterium]
MAKPSPRIGIFGWGIVAPRSPDVAAFERNLSQSESWLSPFRGFGPSNFLVGVPEFDFAAYKPWIDARFEPRKFAQLDEKMGPNAKYAIGAFIQALAQNPGLEEALRDLGGQAHVYVATGLGDLSVTYDLSVHYHHAQRHWDRFWCGEKHHPELAAYRRLDGAARAQRRAELGAPTDPADLLPEDPTLDDALDAWFHFWIERSSGLRQYLAEARVIEAEGVGVDVEHTKGNVIRRKAAARKKLNQRYGCPPEPWTSVDAQLLWNIPNIAAAQISILGGITGLAMAPVGACASFGIGLRMALNAIELGQAKAVVVGTTDGPPHPLTVGAFFNARVLATHGEVSKPLTGMRGTHVAGGAAVWIVGDADYLQGLGMKPLGLEILGVGTSSDADHIITPSEEGPRTAILQALHEAGVTPPEVAAWDMHATATPGDWTELLTALSVFPEAKAITARKGTFGHGMSVCGGWELTAQHLGVARGVLHPVHVSEDELHPLVQPHVKRLVRGQPVPIEGRVTGKISMGVGGVNSCVICRRWE